MYSKSEAVLVKHLDEWDVQPVILIGAQRGEKCSAGFNTNYPLDMRRRQVIRGRSLVVDLLRAEGVEGELNEELWF